MTVIGDKSVLANYDKPSIYKTPHDISLPAYKKKRGKMKHAKHNAIKRTTIIHTEPYMSLFGKEK